MAPHLCRYQHGRGAGRMVSAHSYRAGSPLAYLLSAVLSVGTAHYVCRVTLAAMPFPAACKAVMRAITSKCSLFSAVFSYAARARMMNKLRCLFTFHASANGKCSQKDQLSLAGFQRGLGGHKSQLDTECSEPQNYSYKIQWEKAPA